MDMNLVQKEVTATDSVFFFVSELVMKSAFYHNQIAVSYNGAYYHEHMK